MEDLSLHILDIAENSIAAGAKNIEIIVKEDSANDVLSIELIDDGRGMDQHAAWKAVDPFYTTRTTRHVGLGLPLLDDATKVANGRLDIQSTPEKGTRITATFQLSHIDRKPLGKMAETITMLVARQPDTDIAYRHERDGWFISFSTREIKRFLNGFPLNSGKTLSFIKQYITQEENSFSS